MMLRLFPYREAVAFFLHGIPDCFQPFWYEIFSLCDLKMLGSNYEAYNGFLLNTNEVQKFS